MLNQTIKIYISFLFCLATTFIYGQVTVTAIEDSPVTCFGGNDGQATATPAGGTPPYTILWSNGESGATATLLNAGSHTVTVEDSVGDTASVNVTITEATDIVASAVMDFPVSCNGLNDGMARVSVTGGTPPYSYVWDQSASSSSIANDLSAGVHTITITDSAGCVDLALVTVTEPDELQADAIALTAVICNGEANGSAEVTVIGGSAPYTYTWDQSPSNTATANDLVAGLHTITIEDSNNCLTTATVTIIEPLELTATWTEVSPVNCFGGNDGVAQIDVLGGTFPYSYIWDQSLSNANIASDLVAGPHTVTVTDSNNCSIVVLVTITEPIADLAATTVLDADVSCNGGNDGAATVTVVGGTSPYSYAWDQSTSLNDAATDLVAGIHTITVTDANDCVVTTTITIAEPLELTATATQLSPVVCNGEQNGEAEVIATGGTSPYSYSWDNSTSTTNIASDLGVGLHTITITDANGCIANAFITMVEPDELMASAVEISSVVCYGDDNGEAEVTVEGGMMPYTYSWDQSSSTTSTASDLIAGIHEITITDANGCVITETVTVFEPLELTATWTEISAVTCFGGNDGVASVDVIGGIPPYTYQWDQSIEVTDIASDLVAGVHTVTVTDTNNCVLDVLITVKEPVSELSGTATVDNDVLCHGENSGAATVTATGGTAPYSYSWDRSTSTTASATDLGVGNHTITITDANNCETTTTVTLAEPVELSATATQFSAVVCNGEANGAADIVVNGGTFPYSFSWDKSTSSTDSASDLVGGLHTIIVSDANNCEITVFVTIDEPDLIEIEITDQVSVSCNGLLDGGATISVTGGTAPYTYDWQNSIATGTVASDLSAGDHLITVTDANNCQGTITVTIEEPVELTATAVVDQDALCFGSATGMATVNVLGGTAPYTYLWDMSASTSDVAVDLVAGLHTITIRDANNCETTAEVTIFEPTELTAIAVEDNPVQCKSMANGEATVTVTGGIAPYTYDWDNSTSTDMSANDLVAGWHTITITDANDCEIIATVLINEPDELVGTATQFSAVTCFGEADGAGEVLVTGGVMPYQYAWDKSASAAAGATDLVAGVHAITVTDANGCEIVVTLLIEGPDEIIITEIANSGVLCNGESNGSATINVEGGAFPYTYFWENSLATGPTANDLPAGDHLVTVRDLNNCEATIVVSISEPAVLSATAVMDTETSCFGGSNGSATVTVNGGVAPYTFNWDNSGSTTTSAFDLEAGIHTITIRDSNNCETTTTVTITEPVEIVVDSFVVTPFECVDTGGSITVDVSGGVGTDFFYVWNGPAYAESGVNLNSIGGLTTGGSYTLIVYDENNCASETFSFIVDDNSAAFSVTANVTQQSCATINADASIELILGSGITSPYFIKWEMWTDNGSGVFSWQEMGGTAGSLVINSLEPGEYRATITSGAGGCNEIVEIYSISEAALELVDTNLEPATCTETDALYTFKLNHVNPVEFYLDGNLLVIGGPTLNYNPGSEVYTLSLISGTSNINYLFRILEKKPSGPGTFIDGCDLFENLLVEPYEEISYLGDTTVDIDLCAGTTLGSIESINVAGGVPFLDSSSNPFYNYEWFGPDNYHTLSAEIPSEPGVYQLIISDSENCESTPITFTVNPSIDPIEVSAEIGDVSCGAEIGDGFISVNISGGLQPYTIVWEQEGVGGANPSYTQIATGLLRVNDLEEGRYRLTVTSNIFPCANENPSYIFQEIYVVNSVDSIEVLEEPVYDNELCLGNPGYMTLKVVDTRLGGVNFFYNGDLMTATDLGNNNYELFIANPVQSALLNVVNDDGCGVELLIEIGLGDASFSYDSPGFALSGILSANEPITFTNTTPEPYDSVEWTFGNGGFVSTEASPTQTYAVPGSYDVTLTVFSELGCSTETTQTLVIGGPHVVQFPDVFTPNNDGFNDYFQAEFAGISTFSMEIYDLWNNLIYAEEFTAGSIPSDWGWDGNLSTGEPFLGKVFKYVFKGVDNGGEEVIINNQALLLR